MTQLDVLRGMSVLRTLPAEELTALPSERVVQLAGGAFFEQGSPGDAAYGVITGRVKIAKESAKGRELILDILGPGELFAAVAVLRGIPMPATATALEPTACVRVPGPSFKALIDRHPQASAKILETISRRLLDANAARLGLATDAVEVRIARALLRLGEKFGGRRGEAIVFSQSFTRQNLADLAGTTVETTIRVMTRWTREEIIHSESGRLTIARPEALKQLAEADGDE